jgi:hypothetical protein
MDASLVNIEKSSIPKKIHKQDLILPNDFNGLPQPAWG